MGLMVGGGVSYLVHEAAFQILTSRHKSYAAVATAVSNDRFEDLSRCYIYLRELRIDRSFVGLPGVVGEVKEITDYLKQLPVLFPDISSKLIIKK